MSVQHAPPPATPVPPTGQPRRLDRVREAIRVRHDSLRTEQADVDWIVRFVLFHGQRHPLAMGAAEINQFLTHLAVDGHVSASTQNQAFSTLLFLYQKVLQVDAGRIEGVVRAQRSRRLPVVLTRVEVQQVLARLHGTPHLVAVLLYGAGLRLLMSFDDHVRYGVRDKTSRSFPSFWSFWSFGTYPLGLPNLIVKTHEALRLRVKDLECTRAEIVVREGKADKDRVTMLREVARHPLRVHRERVRELHPRAWADGLGRVDRPAALARQYPNADRDWGWPYVFPATARRRDPRSGVIRRHHVDASVIQRAVQEAVRRAGVHQPATPHTCRHAFATHLLEAGYAIRTVQEL